MHKIGSGLAREHNSGVWQIFDEGGQLQAEFIHAVFPFIVDETYVYFVDFNLDKVCENVQVQLDVDDLVRSARPENGFTNGTEPRLRSYIMDALLASLWKPDNVRAAYRSSLRQKMELIAKRANELGSMKVSVALLKDLGIEG